MLNDEEKNGRRGIAWPRTTATANKKRYDRPLCMLSSIHPPQFCPLCSQITESRCVRRRIVIERRTCASAAGLLLGKAAAVFTNAARGVEEAVLLLPRADGAAVWDEACIVSIERERGCV